jgi:beta-aspartyl-peptidase (threonine type)
MGWKIIVNASKLNKEGINSSILSGAEKLRRGESALDAVEAAIRSMEDNPNFEAGTGCDVNIGGSILMDASIMDGCTLRSGAIGAVQGVKNPITLARWILENTNYSLIVGRGAEELAKALSKKTTSIIVDYDARTPEKIMKYNKALKLLKSLGYLKPESNARRNAAKAIAELLASNRLENLKEALKASELGTVSACALDEKGNYASGASTGGWTLTIPGRIGDSPLIGCGAFADNPAGCASTAGIRGEENARLGGLTRMICDRMRIGESAVDAVTYITHYVENRLNLKLMRGTLIAIDKHGEIGCNTKHESINIAAAYMTHDCSKPNIIVG